MNTFVVVWALLLYKHIFLFTYISDSTQFNSLSVKDALWCISLSEITGSCEITIAHSGCRDSKTSINAATRARNNCSLSDSSNWPNKYKASRL